MDDDRVEDLREEVWRFLGVEACWWAGPVGVELGESSRAMADTIRCLPARSTP
jgi:hypothetical protein